MFRRIGAPLWTLVLAACRTPSALPTVDPAVLDALRSRVGALDRGGVPWEASVIAEFRAGTAAIQEGRAQALCAEEVRRRIDRAHVLLVADIHTLDPIRRAFARLVAACGRFGPTAAVFEAFPPGDDGTLNMRKNSAREDLLDYLQSVWPWPVHALADMLGTDGLRRAEWIGSGNPYNEVPPEYTPDQDRQPVIWLGESTVFDAKYGPQFVPGYGRNGPTADRIDLWLRRAGPAGRVFVLYGLAHYLDGHNPGSGIRSELERRGYHVLIIVPFLPEWEVAIRERGGAAAGAWLEVLPGILRAPLVSDDEILRMGPA